MAIRTDIRIEGIERLQQKLLERKKNLERVLDMKLMQLAEEAVTHAKQNKGYRDRTANLKNSISFALFRDGVLVRMNVGRIPMPDESKKGQQGVQSALETYSQEEGVVAPRGYSLVIVAGMEYGIHVEHKGYNVLHLTKYFLRDEMRTILEETLEDIDKGTI